MQQLPKYFVSIYTYNPIANNSIEYILPETDFYDSLENKNLYIKKSETN